MKGLKILSTFLAQPEITPGTDLFSSNRGCRKYYTLFSKVNSSINPDGLSFGWSFLEGQEWLW